MEDLKKFLTDRLVDDRLAAYEAAAEGGKGLAPAAHATPHEEAHLERYAPARVLEEIKAKQRIVNHWPDPSGAWTASQADAARAVKEHTLRVLASAYADHPDYRTEWALM